MAGYVELRVGQSGRWLRFAVLLNLTETNGHQKGGGLAKVYEKSMRTRLPEDIKKQPNNPQSAMLVALHI